MMPVLGENLLPKSGEHFVYILSKRLLYILDYSRGGILICSNLSWTKLSLMGLVAAD